MREQWRSCQGASSGVLGARRTGGPCKASVTSTGWRLTGGVTQWTKQLWMVGPGEARGSCTGLCRGTWQNTRRLGWPWESLGLHMGVKDCMLPSHQEQSETPIELWFLSACCVRHFMFSLQWLLPKDQYDLSHFTAEWITQTIQSWDSMLSEHATCMWWCTRVECRRTVS